MEKEVDKKDRLIGSMIIFVTALVLIAIAIPLVIVVQKLDNGYYSIYSEDVKYLGYVYVKDDTCEINIHTDNLDIESDTKQKIYHRMQYFYDGENKILCVTAHDTIAHENYSYNVISANMYVDGIKMGVYLHKDLYNEYYNYLKEG